MFLTVSQMAVYDFPPTRPGAEDGRCCGHGDVSGARGGGAGKHIADKIFTTTSGASVFNQ